MHSLLPSEWISRFVVFLRERNPDLPPKDAVSLARAAAERRHWQQRLPEEVAAEALGDVQGGVNHFVDTEASVFGIDTEASVFGIDSAEPGRRSF